MAVLVYGNRLVVSLLEYGNSFVKLYEYTETDLF